MKASSVEQMFAIFHKHVSSLTTQTREFVNMCNLPEEVTVDTCFSFDLYRRDRKVTGIPRRMDTLLANITLSHGT